jgi:hypothetical protein
MTKTLVGTPDPEENPRDAYQDAVFNRLGQDFRRTAKSDDADALAEMRKNRQVNRKIASGGGTPNGGSSLSFATGRPRDPMFYWRQNNLPYDVTKDEELRKIREYCRLLYLAFR